MDSTSPAHNPTTPYQPQPPQQMLQVSRRVLSWWLIGCSTTWPHIVDVAFNFFVNLSLLLTLFLKTKPCKNCQFVTPLLVRHLADNAQSVTNLRFFSRQLATVPHHNFLSLHMLYTLMVKTNLACVYWFYKINNSFTNRHLLSLLIFCADDKDR